MIELVPDEHDDFAFLSLAQRIINGAIEELRMREVLIPTRSPLPALQVSLFLLRKPSCSP